MRLPTVALDRVAHIGTLDPADKCRFASSSYEGHGLSVSVDPERWEEIAELGGLPWHLLCRPHGLFLDFWALRPSQRQMVARWGVEHGLVTRKVVWEVGIYDSELDDTLIRYCESRAEAVEEADLGADENAVRRTTTLAGTEALRVRLGMASGLDAFDHLLVCYVEDEHPELDGVWWWDEYLPLSAPRGVILPGKLAGWTVTPLDHAHAHELLQDEDESENLDENSLVEGSSVPA